MRVIGEEKKIQLVQKCVKGKGKKKKNTVSFPLSSPAPLLKRQDAIYPLPKFEEDVLPSSLSSKAVYVHWHRLESASDTRFVWSSLWMWAQPCRSCGACWSHMRGEIDPILLVSPARGTLGQLGHVHHLAPNGFRQCGIPGPGFRGFFPDSSSAMGFPAWGKQDCCVHPCRHTLSLVQCWSRALCRGHHSPSPTQTLMLRNSASMPQNLTQSFHRSYGKHSHWFWWILNQTRDLLWAYVDIMFYVL